MPFAPPTSEAVRKFFDSSCMPRLMENEGLESNNPADSGGQTYAGISRVFHPDWPGWDIIDGAVQKPGMPSLWDFVTNFYWEKFCYWRFNALHPSPLVNYLFDTGVLFGGRRMVSWAQQGMNEITDDPPLKVDGLIGSATIQRLLGLSDSEKTALIALIFNRRVSHHQVVVGRDKSQKQFLVGWLCRATRIG